MLIEAAKVAPQWNPQLREVYDRAREGGNANQATLEVARKLVRYLLSVDRARKPFVRHAAAAVAGEGSTMAAE